MATVIVSLNTLLPFLYFICAYGYGRYFFRRDRSMELWITPVLGGTFVLHLLQIGLHGLCYRHFPLANVFEATGVLTAGIVVIYLYLEHHLRVKTIGYFVMVAVFFLQLFSAVFFRLPEKVPEILNSPLFLFHAASAIFSCSAIVMSAIASLLYLLLFYEVKHNRFGVLYSRLPSLGILQDINYHAAKAGLLLLTIGIVLGVIWAKIEAHRVSLADIKWAISYAIWAIYALEIVGFQYWKWSGKRLAYLSLLGFLVVLFSLLGVNLFLTAFHAFK